MKSDSSLEEAAARVNNQQRKRRARQIAVEYLIATVIIAVLLGTAAFALSAKPQVSLPPCQSSAPASPSN